MKVIFAIAFTLITGINMSRAEDRFPIIPPDQMNAEQKKLFETIISGPRAQNYGGDAANSFYAIDADTGARRWRHEGGAAGDGGWSAPAVWNGLVIVGTITNQLIAFQAATGTVVWQVAVQGLMEPIVADGVVYGGTGDYSQTASPAATQKVYTIDAATGAILWSADVVGQVKAGAAVGDGKLFLRTEARNVYAFE